MRYDKCHMGQWFLGSCAKLYKVWRNMTHGSSECVSNGSELIHLTGRHTNKASATSKCLSGLLFFFVRRSNFNPNALHGHQHPHRHLLSGVWFSMELVLYRISIYYSPQDDTALLEEVCRVTLAEQRERWGLSNNILHCLWVSQLELQSPEFAAETAGGPRPKCLCEVACRWQHNVQTKG